MEKGFIIRWQSDLVTTKQNVLPVCDKPYHTNKEILQKGEEIENAKLCIGLKYAKPKNVRLWRR